MGPAVDRILYQGHRDEIFNSKDNHFLSKSDHSNVQVWELGRTASRRQHMNDDEFRRFLKDEIRVLPEEPFFRVILIPDTEEDTDRLQLSKPACELMLDKFRLPWRAQGADGGLQYDVNSRFPGMMRRQMQPSRMIDYDPDTGEPQSIQYLYTAIVRSMSSAANPNDPTKRVLDWRRLAVWTQRDMRTGATTLIVLRLPARAQCRLFAAFGDGAEGQAALLRHPMLLHAWLAEWLIVECTQFSQDFAEPLYGMELNFGSTTADFTSRARRFLTMARQMGNVMVDYEIYLASVALLEEVYAWIRDQAPPAGTSAPAWRRAHRDFDGRSFATVRREFELLRRYGQLYAERTRIGNDESTALVNQHDADMSKTMSAESTMIARSAHRDGQSLRIIQYLGLFFLPLSLCTSIFGMGFFGASPSADGSGVVFAVADSWWWFLALALPMTAVVLIITWSTSWWSTKLVDKQRASSVVDIEKMYSRE